MSDILIVCAIDDDDQVIGTYAVDPVTKELPGVAHTRTVDFPDEPQPTGEFVEVIDEDGNPSTVEVLGWPDQDWANIPATRGGTGWVKRAKDTNAPYVINE